MVLSRTKEWGTHRYHEPRSLVQQTERIGYLVLHAQILPYEDLFLIPFPAISYHSRAALVERRAHLASHHFAFRRNGSGIDEVRGSKGGSMVKSSGHGYHRASTVEELTRRNIEAVTQIEAAAHARRTSTDRLADTISSFCGTPHFLWSHVLWFSAWISWNTLAPAGYSFDPYPFSFLTFMTSLEAIFLSTFILISQSHQERVNEQRNLLDLQINLLSEQENTKMLSMLQRLCEKLGIEDDDPLVGVLKESTKPQRVAEQIEEIRASVGRATQEGDPRDADPLRKYRVR
jgi:uncharacterized membrane protein